jgi:4-amino-4-deoxy-L-arabinose transferase-like glycosyltransferase
MARRRRRYSPFPELPQFEPLLPRAHHASYLVLLLALLVRAAAMMGMQSSLTADPDNYRALAENLARTGVLGTDERPSAYRPPLYPLLLRALCVRNGQLLAHRVAIFQVLLGAATTWIVWSLGLRMGIGSWSWLAAGLTLLDPILLNQSALIMTETLAAFLAAVALWLLLLEQNRTKLTNAIAAGFALGLAALCRPTFLAWVALLLPVLLVARVARQRSDAAGNVVAMGMLVGLTLSPWIVRNQQQLGRLIPTTTHGGYTLWLANNPQFYDHLKQTPWTVWDSSELDDERLEMLVRHGGDELAADSAAYDRAMQTIRSRPGDFVYTSLLRLGRFWSPLPHKLTSDESARRRWARLAVALWYYAVFMLAVLGATVVWRQRLPGPWYAGLLLAVALSLVHMVYWSNMRMRAPLAPWLSLLAACGAALLFHRDDDLPVARAEPDPADEGEDDAKQKVPEDEEEQEACGDEEAEDDRELPGNLG